MNQNHYLPRALIGEGPVVERRLDNFRNLPPVRGVCCFLLRRVPEPYVEVFRPRI